MMKAYPKYKESGVEWLGEVPNHWSRLPLKHLTGSFVKDGPHETPIFLDKGIPFLSVDGIQNNRLVFKGCRHISEDDHAIYSKKCKPAKGDVLLGKAASVGKVAYVDTEIDFNVWSPLAVINPKSEVDGRFIFYSLQSKFLQSLCEVKSNSNTQSNLGMKDIDNLLFCLPSSKERRCIVEYLDTEVSKVDNLIAEKENFIKLLSEKRQALISHVVTKGLNPNVPMKDSGVEWVGEIPEHWVFNRLKQNLSVPMMYGANEAALDENPEHPRYIRITDMKSNGELKADSFKSLPPDVAAPYLLNDGDVLLARSGATVGKAFIYREEFGSSCFAGYLIKASVNSEKLLPQFLYYITQSNFYWDYIGNSQITATIQNVSAEKYGNLYLPLPNIEEQNSIIAFLDSKLSTFKLLEDETHESINLLKEHRTALISAAVTGKIDVREEV